jgi:hypothetical protein
MSCALILHQAPKCVHWKIKEICNISFKIAEVLGEKKIVFDAEVREYSSVDTRVTIITILETLYEKKCHYDTYLFCAANETSNHGIAVRQ